MAKVTVIPSTINPLTKTTAGVITKRKVAAYARVSTDSDEQLTSYDAQVEYYTKYIKERPDWIFVDVYADEGITGTNIKRRDGFKRLIDDAMVGKIDLIITKSISRFARNTLDTISFTRQLKAKGIEVYFEKENLWSLDPKSEFILTICASIAQEESRSLSQNVTMGIRWGMQNGKVSWAYKTFLGYRKTKEGKIEIVEEEAAIVRLIYRLFLVEGKTCTWIAKYLNDQHIPTPTKKAGCLWTKTTIDSILQNEKYKGDALLQKTYRIDFLEHTSKKNEGEIPSYYVEGSHPAIIEREEWELVQAEFIRREKYNRSYSATSPFTTKLICEDCGGFYGAKVWHSNDRYRKVIYQCNKKFQKGTKVCKTPSFSEQKIKDKFVKAYNLVMVDREQLIADTLDIISLLGDTTQLDNELERLVRQLEAMSEQVEEMIQRNAHTAQNQEEYVAQYDALIEKYERVKLQYDKTMESKRNKQSQAVLLEAFLAELKKTDAMITEWNADIWNVMLDTGKVHRDGTITFKFKNGTEVTV